MSRRKSPRPDIQAKVFECARCMRVHHGQTLPPGWGHAPGHGVICDDCDEGLQLAQIIGSPRIAA